MRYPAGCGEGRLGNDPESVYRRIPSVDAVLRHEKVLELMTVHGKSVVTQAVRQTISLMRERISTLPGADETSADFMNVLCEQLGGNIRERTESSMRRVINATGVVIHTNLGRAILSHEAAARVAAVASGYSTLEYDLDAGERGSRSSHIERRLSFLFPHQAALAVNNNAAAVFLAVNTLASGRDVVISRGELVEIGGSFRIPDVMAKSGARLREVGTTNRTRLADYEQAIGPETGLILKVHPSNYRIVGFTQEVEISDLAALAHRHGLPLFVDQGSGHLADTSAVGIMDEPTVSAILGSGADVVAFSGDKLLGGPQAGLLLGRQDLIDQMKQSPLYRVLRLDKMTIAALEATLDAHARGTARAEIPVLRMIAAKREELVERASHVAEKLRRELGKACLVTTDEGVSRVGGGAAPTQDLPTTLIRLKPAADSNKSITSWERSLRQQATPVIARVQDETLVLDLRTVDPREEDVLVSSVAGSFRAV